MRQLEPAMRAAAAPLARDPVVLEWFELARGCLHAYFDSADEQEQRAYVASVHAMTSLVFAARTAAPVLVELQGDEFPRQIFEWVRFGALEDLGAGELARELYERHAPRAIAGRADLRALRARLKMPQPPGATPGHELVDEDLRARIARAAERLARGGYRITLPTLARDLGMDPKTLRESIQQSGAEAKDVTRALRKIYGQELKRRSRHRPP
jgi:hypothetical protein